MGRADQIQSGSHELSDIGSKGLGVMIQMETETAVCLPLPLLLSLSPSLAGHLGDLFSSSYKLIYQSHQVPVYSKRSKVMGCDAEHASTYSTTTHHSRAAQQEYGSEWDSTAALYHLPRDEEKGQAFSG